jgi:hypothetical protein
MVSAEKIKKIVLPSVLVMGLGILEIKYPHAMTSFDDNYTGRGISGFILLLIELFITFTWGKVGGVMAILLGGIAIIICFLPSKKEKVEEQPINNSITENDKILSATTLSSFVLHVGKAHIQQQFWNRKP